MRPAPSLGFDPTGPGGPGRLQTEGNHGVSVQRPHSRQHLRPDRGVEPEAFGDEFSRGLTSAGFDQYGIAGNSIESPEVTDGSLTGADLAGGSVGAIDITDNDLTGNDVFNNSLGGVEITDNSLGSADIADGAVRSGELLDNTVVGADVNEASLAPSTDIETNRTSLNFSRTVVPDDGEVLVTYDRPPANGNYLVVGTAMLDLDSGGTTHGTCFLTRNNIPFAGLQQEVLTLKDDSQAYTIPIVGSTPAVAGDEIAVKCAEQGDGRAYVSSASIAIVAVDAVG